MQRFAGIAARTRAAVHHEQLLDRCILEAADDALDAFGIAEAARGGECGDGDENDGGFDRSAVENVSPNNTSAPAACRWSATLV
jgi:hypothetical protein